MNAFKANELLTYDAVRIAVQVTWEDVPADYLDELVKLMKNLSQQ